MNADLRKSFVQFYLESLLERTRREKSGAKWGLDWVIYNLGLERFGKPYRLPFMRSGPDEYATSKTENEFGIDLAFLSEDAKKLTIFVLKDEPLTSRTWTKHDFDQDLRKAQDVPLGQAALGAVEHVTIILAYNKDEQASGIQHFENLKQSAAPTLGGRAKLEFVRWNLSDLVEQVLSHLLNASLVPQKFFGQFSYLCAQAADFVHGSDPWERQLVPGWNRFLSDILKEKAGIRGAALVPVALIILHQQSTTNPSQRTGIIDLSELAAIALWRTAAEVDDEEFSKAVIRFWVEFYVAELYAFYTQEMPHLAVAQSIDQFAGRSFLGPLASGYLAYWHLGRLGLLSSALAEGLHNGTPEDKNYRSEVLRQVATWLQQLADANVAVWRPLIDLNHIEIYLAVTAWLRAGQVNAVETFLSRLGEYLMTRRYQEKNHLVPFIDGGNSLENVFEQAARKEKLIISESSFLVLMLMELACALLPAKRDPLLSFLHSILVLGPVNASNERHRSPLDLISWTPPQEWEKDVLFGPVQGGVAISLDPLSEARDTQGSELHRNLVNVVQQLRRGAGLTLKRGVPPSALVLASIRHHSPLPPELWREAIFPPAPAATAS